MKTKILKTIIGNILILSTITFASPTVTLAKGGVSARPSVSRPAVSRPSLAKPASSRPSAKPSTNSNSSKGSSHTQPVNPKPSSTFTQNRIQNGTKPSRSVPFNSNRNSYNNKDYSRVYNDYLKDNYSSSGFFSGNNILNTFLWWNMFNNLSGRNNHVQASDKQKELAKNLKDSKTPVYMLEIKTKSGETKYITVTKEQYQRVKVNDNITIKDGVLEVK